MKSKIIYSTLLATGFLIGASALSALAVAFTPAPAGGPPPADCPTSIDGCNAPINAGATGQTKSGPLSTFGFSTIGGFNFLPSALPADQPTVGQVLMADASPVVVGGNTVSGLTLGKIKWGTVTGGSGSSGSGITFITPVTICSNTTCFVSTTNPAQATNANIVNGSGIVWRTSSAISAIPAGAKSVILQSTYETDMGTVMAIKIRKDSSSSSYILSSVCLPTGCDQFRGVGGSNQGFFPVSSTNTVDYGIGWNEWSGYPVPKVTIEAIGYVM